MFFFVFPLGGRNPAETRSLLTICFFYVRVITFAVNKNKREKRFSIANITDHRSLLSLLCLVDYVRPLTEKLNNDDQISPLDIPSNFLHEEVNISHQILLEQITQALRYSRFVPVIYIDFLQAFDKLWHQGLILKLSRLNCPSSYLIWLVNYFSNRSMKIDYNGIESSTVNVERGAPQGSCLGPVIYVISHFDLPQLFLDPMHVHAYVDDIAIAYPPSIHLNHKQQIAELEKQINNDMVLLLKYTNDWHQPLNPNKTETVVYHNLRQSPRLNINYDGIQICQKNSFKYLGFHLDSKLTFRFMIDAQFIKLRKAYVILKYIHRQFPSFNQLKTKFFNTYIWPHLYMMATIYCLFNQFSRDRLAAFYRRCLRLIFQLYQCPTKDLHGLFKLPTIDERFKRSLMKRTMNIQMFEPSLIDCVLQYKHLMNVLHDHYHVKASIKHLPQGRPNNGLSALVDSSHCTYFDRLINFVFT